MREEWVSVLSACSSPMTVYMAAPVGMLIGHWDAVQAVDSSRQTHVRHSAEHLQPASNYTR